MDRANCLCWKNVSRMARIYIKKIVEQINAMLANDMQRAVTAALNKHSHSPLRSISSCFKPFLSIASFCIKVF